MSKIKSPQKLAPKDYSYLKEIDWGSQVMAVKVELTEKKNGVDTSKTISYVLNPMSSKQTLIEALIQEDIIKDEEGAVKQINDKLQDSIEFFIQNKIDTYEKAVRIYNDITTINVKDKRTYSCGEEHEGEIQHKEIECNMTSDYKTPEKYEYWNGEKCISEFPLKLDFPCPYHYDFTKDGVDKYQYNPENCIVKDGTHDMRLTITFCDWYSNTKDKMADLFIPTPNIFYVMKDSKNEKQTINLISNCDESSKYDWKKQRHVYKRAYRSSAITSEWRMVTLNTFIVYCREKNANNKDSYIQDIKEKANEDEMMKEVIKKFGEENVTKIYAYKEDVNFNGSAYWGKYALKVSLKDGSYLLYDYSDMQRYKKLNLLGLYDSTYKKETTKSAYERVMKTNKQDTFARYDFEEMKRQNK